MKHLVLWVIAVAFLAPASDVGAQGVLIDEVIIDHPHISPNGDGVNDMMIITYDLADTTTAVYVLILQSDSTSVDTLVAGIAQGPSMSHQTTWDGTVAGGVRVADDDYLVLVTATNGVITESEYRPIAVDVVRPQVFITNLFPSPFGPGSPDSSKPKLLIVEFATFDPHPSQKILIQVWVTDPSGDTVATVLADTLVDVGGTHTVTWDGAPGDVDGLHNVRVRAVDLAGNSDATRSPFALDLDSPEVQITNFTDGQRLRVVPDSLYGWVWDSAGDPANTVTPGIDPDSLFVSYSGGFGVFEPIQATWTITDTVFFAVQIVDSIIADSTLSVGIRAVDRVGRIRIETISVVWDTTAPPPPVLAQPKSPTRNPVFVVNATFDAQTDSLRIFHNGTLFATVNSDVFQVPGFQYTLSLVPGDNTIYVVAVDAAGNESGPSNMVFVVLDPSPGLRISQPFVPDDAFLVNLAQPAGSVTLRVYDLGGNLVNLLRASGGGSNVSIPWNGRNGSGTMTRKGPLVAVAKIEYLNGDREIFRGSFLFEP